MYWKAIAAGGAVLAIAAVAVAVYYFWPFGESADELRLPGVVEIQEVRLGSRVGGRVYEVDVAEGDEVKANRLLVKLQAPELDAQLTEWQGQLHQAEAQLDRVKQGPRYQELAASAAAEEAAHARLIRSRLGSRPEEVEEARADAQSAKANAANARVRFDRDTALYAKQAVKKEELDDARTALDQAQSAQAAAEAKLTLVEAGNRIEDIEEAADLWRQAQANHRLLVEQTPLDVKEAEGKVDEAKGKVDEIAADLRELEVKAPEPSLVEVVSVRPGDLVAPNQPIIRVLRTGDLWIKVYMPETNLSHVRLNQEVAVTVDGYPGRRLKGRIEQINAEAEFTPRNVQSVDERRHQVFGIRVFVADPEGILKSGMAAEVVIPLAP